MRSGRLLPVTFDPLGAWIPLPDGQVPCPPFPPSWQQAPRIPRFTGIPEILVYAADDPARGIRIILLFRSLHIGPMTHPRLGQMTQPIPQAICFASMREDWSVLLCFRLLGG